MLQRDDLSVPRRCWGEGHIYIYICCVMRELNEGIFTEVTLAEVYCLSYTVEVFPIAHDVCVCMFLVIQVYIYMIHVNISSIYYCVCYHNNHTRMVCSHTSFQPMKLSGRQEGCCQHPCFSTAMVVWYANFRIYIRRIG